MKKYSRISLIFFLIILLGIIGLIEWKVVKNDGNDQGDTGIELLYQMANEGEYTLGCIINGGCNLEDYYYTEINDIATSVFIPISNVHEIENLALRLFPSEDYSSGCFQIQKMSVVINGRRISIVEDKQIYEMVNCENIYGGDIIYNASNKTTDFVFDATDDCSQFDFISEALNKLLITDDLIDSANRLKLYVEIGIIVGGVLFVCVAIAVAILLSQCIIDNYQRVRNRIQNFIAQIKMPVQCKIRRLPILISFSVIAIGVICIVYTQYHESHYQTGIEIRYIDSETHPNQYYCIINEGWSTGDYIINEKRSVGVDYFAIPNITDVKSVAIRFNENNGTCEQCLRIESVSLVINKKDVNTINGDSLKKIVNDQSITNCTLAWDSNEETVILSSLANNECSQFYLSSYQMLKLLLCEDTLKRIEYTKIINVLIFWIGVICVTLATIVLLYWVGVCQRPITAKLHQIDTLLDRRQYIKYINIFVSLLFLSLNVFMMVKYCGFFAGDEFYHISTIDRVYEPQSAYNRALYIDWFEKVITSVLGKKDMVVKLVPFIMGIISFSSLLILTNKIIKSPLLILCVMVTFICNPLLIVNHMYIRMYVFLEAIMCSGALMIFLSYEAREKHYKKREKIYFGIFGILFLFYSIFTKDMSRYFATLIYVACVFLFFFGNCTIAIISKLRKKKIILFCGSLFLTIEVFIILVKQEIILLPLPDALLSRGINMYAQERPVMLEFFLGLPALIILLLFVLCGIWLYKCHEVGLINIYAMVALPLIVYFCILYNNALFRTLTCIIPIFIVLSMLYVDRRNTYKLLFKGIGIMGCFFLTIFSYPSDFIKTPYIENEVVFGNMRSVFQTLDEKNNEGVHTINMYASQRYEYYFEKVPTEDFSFDSYFKKFAPEDRKDEYDSTFRYILELNEPTAVFMDAMGFDYLYSSKYYDEWLEKFMVEELVPYFTMYYTKEVGEV